MNTWNVQLCRLKGSASLTHSQFLLCVNYCHSYHQNIFRCLQLCRGVNKSCTTWKPFRQTTATPILKSLTFNMTGVSVTVKDLRTAAESYVDTLANRSTIQPSLSYVEGHTTRTAETFYKRNGSDTLMREWTRHVEHLIEPKSGNDKADDTDLGIKSSIQQSDQRWLAETRNNVNDILGVVSIGNHSWKPVEDETSLSEQSVCSGHKESVPQKKLARTPNKAQEVTHCFLCRKVNPPFSRSQKRKRSDLQKCEDCVRKVLLQTLGENQDGQGIGRKRRRKKEGKTNKIKRHISVCDVEEIQSTHFVEVQEFQSGHF